MTLFDDLIVSTQFEQAKPIWQEDQAKDVFEPFFACLVASMMDDAYFVWLQNFIATTKNQANLSLTAHTDPLLDEFWQVGQHKRLLDKLGQVVPVPKQTLEAVLPLAAHTGYQVLLGKACDPALILSVIDEHVQEVATALPMWADEVLEDRLLAMLSVESLLLQSLDEPQNFDELKQAIVNAKINESQNSNDTNTTNNHIKDTDTSDANLKNTDKNKTDTPISPLYDSTRQDVFVEAQKSSSNFVWIGLLVLVLVLVLAMLAGGYYYLSYPKAQLADSAVSDGTGLAVPVVQSLPPSMLSITVDEKDGLYACHAELGTVEWSDKLAKLLQDSFGATMCIIDINESVQQTMPHFDKLKSVIALLKSAPYATLQLQGEQVYINAPNTDDIERLVVDIGTLMGDAKVSAMPDIDSAVVIEQSLDKAQTALDGLPASATGFELAHAMSLQRFDNAKGFVPEGNRAILAKSAKFLQNRPDTRLIIVVHSDDVGNEQTAQLQTQAVADAIKTELLAHGVGDGQLVAKGVGAKFPFADNQTKAGRFYNRRVEFLVYDDAIMQALDNAQLYIPQSDPVPVSMGGTDVPTYAVVDGQIVQQNGLMPPSAPVYAESQSPPPSYDPPTYAPPSYDPPAYTPQPINRGADMGDIDDLLNIGSDPAVGAPTSQITVN